jgi:hypothetical protein
MSKYIVNWELDVSRWSTDQKERAAMSIKMGEKIKQNMKEGKTLDWGIYVGGVAGYTVVKGNAPDVYKELRQYYPYMTFKVQEVLSLDEALEVWKS